LFAEEFLRQTAKRFADSSFEKAAKDSQQRENVLIALKLYQEAREGKSNLSDILEQ
jgi:hypothetical protein